MNACGAVAVVAAECNRFMHNVSERNEWNTLFHLVSFVNVFYH